MTAQRTGDVEGQSARAPISESRHGGHSLLFFAIVLFMIVAGIFFVMDRPLPIPGL